MKYRLKPGKENFDMVDGPFAGKRYRQGKIYQKEDIPETEMHKFEEAQSSKLKAESSKLKADLPARGAQAGISKLKADLPARSAQAGAGALLVDETDAGKEDKKAKSKK